MLALERADAAEGSAFTLAGQLCRKGKNPTEHQETMKAALEEALDGDTWLRTLEMRASLAQSPTLRGKANRFLAALHCARIGGSGTVASASAWEKAGRPLKEDAEGFQIWVARQVTVDSEPEDGAERGAEDQDDSQTRTVFRFGGNNGNAKYYDISETEGDETSTDRWGHLSATQVGDGGASDEAFRDAMHGAVENLGLSVVHVDPSKMKGAGHIASLSWGSNEVRVRAGMTPAAEAAAIAHELGHYCDPYLAGFGSDSFGRAQGYELNRDACEFVAESVAYAVSHAWGVDTSQTSAEYLHNWRPDRARQAKNLVERGESSMDKLLEAASLDKHREWAEAA